MRSPLTTSTTANLHMHTAVATRCLLIMPQAERTAIDRDRLAKLIARENATLASRTKRSLEMAKRGKAHMIGANPATAGHLAIS
jgi:hypothetical protein